MHPHRQYLLVLHLAAVCYHSALAQELVVLTPPTEHAKHAITFDLGGNTPVVGASYHYQLIQFANAQRSYAGAIEVSAGIGFIPSICIFGCSQATVTTHHSLLLLWGHKLQAELGYAGLLTPRGALYQQAYLPGVCRAALCP